MRPFERVHAGRGSLPKGGLFQIFKSRAIHVYRAYITVLAVVKDLSRWVEAIILSLYKF